MLAIEVDYLLGRAVATDYGQRDIAEWPPHPQRLFSALVDAHFSDAFPAGEKALKWLEALGPPALATDATAEGESYWRRDVGKFWVPVNDELPSQEKHIRAAPLREQRKRQERFFPAVTLADSRVWFVWPDAEPALDDQAALKMLTERLCYLGHSSSLIRAQLKAQAPASAWVPSTHTNAASITLRVPGKGRFDRLTAVHEQRQINELVQAPLGKQVQYVSHGALAASSPFEEIAGLRIVAGPRIGLEATAPLMIKLRKALLAQLGVSQPEILSGHLRSGAPARAAHLVLAPLANINHEHADGSIKGFIALLPRNADPGERATLTEALGRINELKLGGYGVLRLRAFASDPELKALDFARRYARVSTHWRTATPLVLGRHPRQRFPDDAVAIVAAEIENAGYPRPRAVRLLEVPLLKGTPHAREIHRMQAKQLQGRMIRHAEIEFETPLRGPVCIGAGRFIGLGLCLPGAAP